MIHYELNILIAVFAFVYSYIITRPHQILNGVYNWLWALFKTDQRQANGKGPHPIFMMVMYCEKCVSGQLAFWIFVYFNYAEYFHAPFETFITHFLSVAFTILCAATISGLYTKHIENNG